MNERGTLNSSSDNPVEYTWEYGDWHTGNFREGHLTDCYSCMQPGAAYFLRADIIMREDIGLQLIKWLAARKPAVISNSYAALVSL